MLLDALPGESAYKTAVRDAIPDERLAEMAALPRQGHGPWSHTDLLIGALVDLARWQIHATYTVAGAKPKQPEPFPMPGVGARKRKALTAEGHAYLQRLRAEHAQLHGYDDAEGA